MRFAKPRLCGYGPFRGTSDMKRIALIAVGFSFLASCTTILGDFSAGPDDSGPGVERDGEAKDAGKDAGKDAAKDAGKDAKDASESKDAANDGEHKDAAKDGAEGDARAPKEGGGSGDDGGAADVEVDSDIVATAVDVTAANATVFIEQTAALHATATTTPDGANVAYLWTLVSVPAGSAVVAASLSGARTASVSFVPDVAGAYVLTVSATSGSVSGTTAATATAVAPTVFYMRGDLVTPTSFSAAYYASGSDGTAVHAVTCAVTESTQSSGFLSPVPQTYQYWVPDDHTDYWEAPAGQASLFAVIVYDGDPSGDLVLFVGSATGSCTTPPTSIVYPGGSAQPRFSADGTRLAFIGATDLSIVTVNPDGTDQRVVANYSTGAVDSGTYDPSPAGFALPPRPQWAGKVVAWVRQYSAPGAAPAWEIVKATDVAGATPVRYMACPGATPREFQFLSDGSVIVAYRTTLDASTATSGPENLYRLTPDGSKNCTIVNQYTDLANSGISQASDFAVSPDGTKIAFVEVDVDASAATTDSGYASAALPGGYPYVVGVGGGTPTKLSNDFLMFGPRWIGGGSRLVATRYDGYTDAGFVELATSVIVRAPTAGPSPTPLVKADGYNTFAVTGSNGGCSMATGAVPPAMAFLVLLAAAALARFVRRRPPTRDA